MIELWKKRSVSWLLAGQAAAQNKGNAAQQLIDEGNVLFRQRSKESLKPAFHE